MKFLGAPVFMFEAVCKRLEPYLPAWISRSAEAGSAKRKRGDNDTVARGRPSTFTVTDTTAIMMRLTHIRAHDYMSVLCADFSRNASTMKKYVNTVRPAMLNMLREWHLASVHYPLRAEAELLHNALIQRFGAAPSGVKTFTPVGILIDGTLTDMFEPPAFVEQKLMHGANKGTGVNSVLAHQYDGIFVDYVLCGYGSTNDSKLAAPLFKRFNSTEHNPDRIAAIVDVGFSGYCNDGADGRPSVWRPAFKEELVDVSIVALAVLMSAYVSKIRQPNEWANSAIKVRTSGGDGGGGGGVGERRTSPPRPPTLPPPRPFPRSAHTHCLRAKFVWTRSRHTR